MKSHNSNQLAKMRHVGQRLSLLLAISFTLASGAGSQISATGRTNAGSFPVDESLLRGDSASIQLQKSVIKRANTGKNWLLVIGISQYVHQQDWKNLINPVNDATALWDLLLANYRFDFKRSRALYDKEATREHIFDALTSFRKEIKSEDNLLIYYAGHGKLDDEVAGRGYWIPADAKRSNSANYISTDDLKPFLQTMKARSVLIVSDACFSASLFRGSETRWTYNNPDNLFDRISTLAARFAITSGGEEPVLDAGSSVRHSVFAYFLLDALSRNKDSYLPATKLFQTIKEPVASHTRQVPECLPLTDGFGHLGGEFIFYKK